MSGTHFPNRSVLMTRIVSPTQPAASRPADDLWYRIFQLRYCRRGCGARSNSGNDRSNRGSTGATHTGTHSYVAPGNGPGGISRNCAKTDATTYSLVTAGSASNKNKSLGTIRVRTNMPGWRNGRRCGLKIRCPKGRAGSTPALGTSSHRPFALLSRLTRRSASPVSQLRHKFTYAAHFKP